MKLDCRFNGSLFSSPLVAVAIVTLAFSACGGSSSPAGTGGAGGGGKGGTGGTTSTGGHTQTGGQNGGTGGNMAGASGGTAGQRSTGGAAGGAAGGVIGGAAGGAAGGSTGGAAGGGGGNATGGRGGAMGGNAGTGTCQTGQDCPAGQLCSAAAHTCADCTTDSGCQNSYGGSNYLCVSGACVSGNCRATGDCTGGLVCMGMTCSPCTGDGQCPTNDICVGGACIPGNCHSTASCTAGQVCDLATHSCSACASDAQCSTSANYGAGHYCQNSACVAGQCRTANDCTGGKLCSGLACVACTTTTECTTALGSNHVCMAGSCVSGNCVTTADCTGGGQLCKSGSCAACAMDSDCTGDSAYGAQHLCIAGVCTPGSCRVSADCAVPGQICSTTTHSCAACSSDTTCKSDSTYGSTFICLASVCVVGDCHDTSADCTAGKICGIATAHACGSCASDANCTADTRYGAGNICYQGSCGPGNCHASSADCMDANAGLICGVSTTNTCGACTADGQCKSDAAFGNADMCTTANVANKGKCVSAACTTNGTACANNPSDFCCGGQCVAGNCCSDTDCVNNANFGVGYACKANTCSQCAPASGNKYYVDPVNGNDQTATGSGLSGSIATPSCSFKTITRAIAVIGTSAPANTKIILTGVAGQTRGLAAGDTLPITLPPNVVLTTTTGPITITLATTALDNPAGFRLLNGGSGIAGDPSAPLTLDGNNHLAGIGIQVAAGTGSTTLSNISIRNTGGHGINVTSGTLNIGAGVVVTGAGVAATARDGLLVSGGVANIVVPASQAQTSFNNNTLHGIEVSGLGSINVTGVLGAPVPSNNGTVIVANNTTAGLRINQNVVAANLATSSISGLVAWANRNHGARILGGSHVKVRGSVFGSNLVDGILISNASGTLAGNDLSRIDLGASVADPGLNYLQTPLGALGTNLTAGLCVAMSNGLGALTLNAAGNFLVSTDSVPVQVNCSTAAMGTPISKAATCTSGNSIGGMTASGGTTVTVNLNRCM